MPRIPTHMDGTSAAHMPVSETTIDVAGQPVRARGAAASAKCGEPDSSSPSTSSLSVTGGAVRPAAARPARGAEQVEQDLALVVGGAAGQQLAVALGRLERRAVPLSSGSTGWTSWWP